jgi:predicted nucleic acid-binding protein
MTIQDKKIAFDTNIWIFGLRQHYEYPSCFALLKLLDMINIVIPRQILKELQVNLTESEFREFFHTLGKLQSNIIVSWEKASEENIIKYQNLGCKRRRRSSCI